MKSFVIAICVLISITIYILITSVYFLHTEEHLISELEALSLSDDKASLERLNRLYSYIAERNKILSLYIHRSKCTEFEFLLKEMEVHLQSGNPLMLHLTASKLREALLDIHDNDTFPSLSGIT